MDSLDKKVVRIRLRQLNSSQNSVQTMSLWIAHHHNEAALTAECWLEELCTNRGTSDWCKAMFYLLNDVVQNCRKDKKHVCDAFYQPFLSAVEKLGRRQFDKWEKVIGSVFRVIGILKERAVYTPEQIEELKTSINWRPADGSQASSSTTSAAPDPNKVTPKKEEKPPLTVEQRQELRNRAFKTADNALVKILSPASTDSAVRQKIATYPETIADTRRQAEAKSVAEAREVFAKASEAHPLVKSYAKRVKEELQDTRDAQKAMDALAEFMKLEMDRDRMILGKTKKCLEGLYKKQERLASLRQSMKETESGAPPAAALPDIGGDDI